MECGNYHVHRSFIHHYATFGLAAFVLNVLFFVYENRRRRNTFLLFSPYSKESSHLCKSKLL